MKGKLKSIGRVSMALLLAVSLGLIMAAPAAADSPDVGYEFTTTPGETAEWSNAVANETAAMGAYSVKLVAGNDGADWAQVVLTPPAAAAITLGDMADITTGWSWWYYKVSGSYGTQLELCFQSATDPDGYAEMTIMDDAYGPGEAAEGAWTEQTIVSATTTGLVFGTTEAGDAIAEYPVGSEGTIADLVTYMIAQETDGDAGAWVLTEVRPGLGWIPTGPTTAYIDDVTIDGTLYELEPIFVDTAHPYFYTSGSTVTVTVPNATANADSVRAETVTVGVTSTTDGTGFQPDVTDGEGGIVLTETGPDTGVFQGSFPTTLDVPPGAGELVVADADEITVTYGGASALQVDWGTGASVATTTISATVDDSIPTIEAILMVAGESVTTPGTIIFDSAPEIVATVTDVGSDIDEASIVMTVNSQAVVAVFTSGTGAVAYTVDPALDPGAEVTVTVGVSDNMGNAAETASWSFTIADEFNISVDTTSMAAVVGDSGVVVTFSDVADKGPGDGGTLLETVKVTLTGPGVSLASGDFDGTTEGTKGDATAFDTSSLTFGVTPEQAGTITVTVVGTFLEGDPITKTRDISVTGYLVEETWLDVGMETTGTISLRVTTEAGVAVNTGIVTIAAALSDGFEKDIDPVATGDEPFTEIVIDGSAGEITYDAANPEDFLVSDGNYEVTGITFANIGAVTIAVADAGSDAKASFTTAFTVLGIDVYDLSFEPATLTAGVDLGALAITVTEVGEPVTDVKWITIGAGEAVDVSSQAPEDGVYTVDPALVSEVTTLNVIAKNADNTRYGSADLGVALPTLSYEITEGTDVRDLMIVGAAYDYTIAVTALDAQGEPLALGQVWLGTYVTATDTFTALLTTGDGPADAMPLDLDADGLGDLVIAQDGDDLLSVGTLVWKVADDAAADHTVAALLPAPSINVEALIYSVAWTPEAPTVGEEITFTATDNYDAAAGNRDAKVVSPGGDLTEKVTTPTGSFKYTATEAGDYYVSVRFDADTWQDPDTVTVVGTLLASIAAPESVDLYVEETEQLAITATYEDETELDVTADATYASDDDTVATVSVAGLITAVAEGTATITVSYTEGVITETADVLVTVSEVPVLASIASSPDPVSLNVGGTEQLAITATYSDASTAVVTAEATYASDDDTVATVSVAGLVTAVAEGTATITVSYTEDEITVTDDVSVTVTVVEPLTIQLYEGANPILYTGATMDLPGALTDIETITEIIWQRDVSTGGEWYSYLVSWGVGEITQLENGTVYIIVVSEGCIWELSQ